MQVEQLEQEMSELQQVLSDKKEQEAAMLKVFRLPFVFSHFYLEIIAFYSSCSGISLLNAHARS